jgi:hypothetical protein
VRVCVREREIERDAHGYDREVADKGVVQEQAQQAAAAAQAQATAATARITGPFEPTRTRQQRQRETQTAHHIAPTGRHPDRQVHTERERGRRMGETHSSHCYAPPVVTDRKACKKHNSVGECTDRPRRATAQERSRGDAPARRCGRDGPHPLPLSKRESERERKRESCRWTPTPRPPSKQTCIHAYAPRD